jgi:hypothetical protein
MKFRKNTRNFAKFSIFAKKKKCLFVQTLIIGQSKHKDVHMYDPGQEKACKAYEG